MVLELDRAYKAAPMKPRLAIALSLLASTVVTTARAQSAAPTTPGTVVSTPAATPATTPPSSTVTAQTTTSTEPAKIDEQPVDPNTENTRAVYLSADIGFTRADLGAFTNSYGFDKTAANGLLAGFGVGYRHRAFRIGARFRDHATTEFSLWSLMAEVGWGLPMKRITPVIMLRGGYVFDTGIQRAVFASRLPEGNRLTPNIDVDGLDLGVEISAPYAVTRFLKVGPFLGVDALFLHRAQPRAPQSIQPNTDETLHNDLFGDSGNGIGYIFNVGLRVTGDVGF
ncbi:MAG: hypothetical protein JWP97_2961 [Labilithrix sp.]|nr:hypothetical protein [Labilithrix sp.]